MFHTRTEITCEKFMNKRIEDEKKTTKNVNTHERKKRRPMKKYKL